MASVNKVILIGHLGKDPETKYMTNGEAATNIALATTEVWKDKSGEKQQKTEWHKITFYRKLAEVVGEYCKKGKSIYVEGRLETRKWTDKQGIDRYTTEIIATDMKMLGSKGSGEAETQPQQARQQSSGGNGFADMQDDIPF